MNNSFVPIATKINLESYAQIKQIADKNNLKVYQMLQTVIDSYLKYLSEDTVITDSLQNVVQSFANFRLTKESFSFCAPYVERNKLFTNNCIFLLEGKNKPQKQPILIKQEKGKVLQTINRDSILIVFLSAFMPEIIKDLKGIKTKYNLLSISDSLSFAVKETTEPDRYSITREIETLFNDNNTVDFGEHLDYEEIGQYKRVYSRDGYTDMQRDENKKYKENLRARKESEDFENTNPESKDFESEDFESTNPESKDFESEDFESTNPET